MSRFYQLASAAFVGVCFGLITDMVQATEREQPNIIFILADDLGYGDLGCYGQTRIKTPNIDQMAKEGMRFTDFYAGCTVCAPSRCVLMTGLDTGKCYIRGNGKNNLRPEDLTVAEVLKEAGYATGLIGKWGLGHEGSTGVPTKKGFDYFFGYLDQHHAHLYYPTFLVRNEERVPLRNVVPDEGPYGQGVATVEVDYTPKLMMNETLAFLDRHQKDPFFLYLAYTLPHANNEKNKQLGDGTEIPDYGIYADKDWTKQNKGQAAMVTYLDDMVGQVIERLDKLGLTDDTIVMFTSDNGPHSEAGNDVSFFDANGPVTGIKRAMYDGGIRVPMIVKWPGKVEADSTTPVVAGGVDFMATAADLVGIKLDAPTDGISFLPTLLGKPDQQQVHDVLYWEFYEQGSKQAIRSGQWKAVRRPMGTGPIEIYDVSIDVAENVDIARQRPDLVSKFREQFEQRHQPTDDWSASGKVPSREATRADGRN